MMSNAAKPKDYSVTEPEAKTIETRLALIERDLESIANTKRWIQGVIVFLLIQMAAGIYQYGQLNYKVDAIDITELQQNISSALTVLADHGTEFETVRGLITRNLTRGDARDQVIDQLRQRIDAKTNDRFYRSDGARLESRITRLENFIFEGTE